MRKIERKAKKLFDVHREYIEKLCDYKLGHRTEYTDECMQEVFIAFVEALEKGIYIENYAGWLTAVTDNISTDLLKDIIKYEKSTIPLDEGVERLCYESDEYFVDENEMSDEEIESLKETVFSELSEYEMGLLKDYRAGKRQKVMAAERNISENCLRQQIFRLKQKVKKKVHLLFDNE